MRRRPKEVWKIKRSEKKYRKQKEDRRRRIKGRRIGDGVKLGHVETY